MTHRRIVRRMTTIARHETSRLTAHDALMTAEELLVYPMPDKRVELVRGRLVVREPPGMRHGECAMRIGVALSNFLMQDRESSRATATRGRVVTCDAGFTLARGPDTVRGPDVAYVSRERWAGPRPDGYGEFAPDIAVEVRSPSDRAGELLAKVGDWLDAGTSLVWIVDPLRRTAQIFRPDGSVSLLGVADSLDGEDVLPGFSLPVATVME